MTLDDGDVSLETGCESRNWRLFRYLVFFIKATYELRGMSLRSRYEDFWQGVKDERRAAASLCSLIALK